MITHLLSRSVLRTLPVVALLMAGLSIAGMGIATTRATEIYKHTDAEGNVTFSDQPSSLGEEAEKIQLQELNTTPATQPTTAAPGTASTVAEQESAEKREFSVSIASPTDETTIAMGPGNVTVTAQATPALGNLEQLQLFLDGEAFGDPQRSNTWFLKGLMRGPHDLEIERLDRRGNSLARSDSVRIFVLRPSVNQPQRP